jgi:hypothetical protein
VSGTPGVITFPGINGQSEYANNWDLHNFGPRLGFAWKPANKLVVRGGGAILFNAEYALGTTTVAYTGFDTQGSFASSNNGKTPAFILENGFPALNYPTIGSLTPGYGAVPVGQAPTMSVQYIEPNRGTAYSYQYNFDIQREIGAHMLLDIGYLGTFGHHLSGPASSDYVDINQVPTSLLGPGNLQSLRPFPQFGSVQILGDDIGRSNYNGLNVGIERRFSSGFQFRANYTYAKFLDNISGSGDLGGGSAFTNYYNEGGDYGRSGNDIRHRIVMSSLYNLPVGDGKAIHFSSGFLNRLVGGHSCPN